MFDLLRFSPLKRSLPSRLLNKTGADQSSHPQRLFVLHKHAQRKELEKNVFSANPKKKGSEKTRHRLKTEDDSNPVLRSRGLHADKELPQEFAG